MLLDLYVCCGGLYRLMSVNRWVGLLIDAQVRKTQTDADDDHVDCVICYGRV